MKKAQSGVIFIFIVFGLVLSAIPHARAGVIYTPYSRAFTNVPSQDSLSVLNDTLPILLKYSDSSGQLVPLDIDWDGFFDILLSISPWAQDNINFGTVKANLCENGPCNSLIGVSVPADSIEEIYVESPVSCAYALNYGEAIGLSSPTVTSQIGEVYLGQVMSTGDTLGFWNKSTGKYLGIYFQSNIDDQMHYGWIRLNSFISSDSVAVFFVEGYAYESVPNKTIYAGDTGTGLDTIFYVNIIGNTNICPGDSTQLTANVYNGSGKYSYTWSPSIGVSDTAIANPYFSPAKSIVYKVTVTDDSTGNISQDAVVISVAALSIDGSIYPEDSCGVNDGAINVYVNNGQSPFSYQWSNDDSTFDIAGLAPGRYAVTVQDVNGCKANISWLITDPCDSVWPGDANSDGVVDYNDVIQIWYAYGDTGLVRPNASILWVGQPATPWPLYSWWDFGINEKFTDCNGDGVINDTDLIAVNQNYTLLHNKTGPVNRALHTDPYLTLVPESDSIYPNSAFKVKIMLGNTTTPVDSLFALAFQINFDPAVFDTANVQLNIDSSWMGATGVNLSSFKKVLPGTGQIILALGRTNRTNTGGNGEIGELTLMINANIPAQPSNNVTLTPIVLRGTTVYNIPVNFNIQGATATVVSGINELPMDRSVNISPNPNNGNFVLSIDQPSKQLTIELLNIQGMRLHSEQLKDIPSLNKEYNFGDLAKGVYLLKISTENGVVTRQLVVQ